MMGLFRFCDCQIYNIFIAVFTKIFGILYYLNNVAINKYDPNINNNTVGSVVVSSSNNV